MNEKKRLGKTTKKQYEELLGFIEKHKSLVGGKMKPTDIPPEKLWIDFAAYINPLAYGPQKSGPQWRNVFSEWKTNTRRKSRAAYKESQRTGGGLNAAKPLTDLEQRLLGLFGKIHLGDLEIDDSFNINSRAQNNGSFNVSENSITEEVPEDPGVHIEEEEEEEPVLILEENNRRTTAEPPAASIFLEPPSTNSSITSVNPSRKRKIPQPHSTPARKSRAALLEATKIFENTQKVAYETAKVTGASMQNVADALLQLSKTYQEVSTAKLKLEYLKHFGTLEGFQKLF